MIIVKIMKMMMIMKLESHLPQIFAVRLESLTEKVMFQISGFIIVMSVLALLWTAISMIGIIFSRLGIDLEKGNERRIEASETHPMIVKDALSKHHIAAITAALHTTMKGPYKIVDVREMKLPDRKKMKM